MDTPLLVTIDSSKIPSGDGTYWFRVVGWDYEGSGLTNRRALPLRGATTEPANVEDSWVLTFDNPNVQVAPYPDAQILEVLVDGAVVNPCDVGAPQRGQARSRLQGLRPGRLARRLHTGGDLRKRSVGEPTGAVELQLLAQAADCVGPEYGRALLEPASPGTPCTPPSGGTPCATAPTWHGGEMRLTVDLDEAFPIPCCYQLNLHVWTRHILNCGGDPWPYENWQWYTIGYGVCPPPVVGPPAAAMARLADVEA